MPKFCTSCGSAMEENLNFCPSCGAQVGAPAPSAPAPAPAAAPTPGVAPAAAPAAKAGSPILKIVLIVVGILVLVGAIGTVTCVYVAYRAKQKLTSMVESGKTISGGEGTPQISLERGGEGSEAAAAATVDVPPYPNATATEGGGQLSFGGAGGISSQEYETTDSVDQVVAFYKNKLGSKAHIQESEGKAIITLTTKKGLTTVTVSREGEEEKTKIAIARIGK